MCSLGVIGRTCDGRAHRKDSDSFPSSISIKTGPPDIFVGGKRLRNAEMYSAGGEMVNGYGTKISHEGKVINSQMV